MSHGSCVLLDRTIDFAPGLAGFVHYGFAGLASFTPEVQAGIYRVPKSGGAATLFAKDPELFRIDTQGVATRWSGDAALGGNKDACDGAGPGFAIGANGLVVEQDAVYVVNLDQATLVKLPRQSDGRAGAAVVLAGPMAKRSAGPMA